MNKILFPINNGTISQKYGENPELYQSRFGITFHNGTDIVSFHGDELLCCEDFIPYKIFGLKTGSVSRGFGFHALTRPNDKGICEEWVYWHTMSNLKVSLNKLIQQGEVVGYEGASGDVFSGGKEVPDNLKGVAPLFLGTHLHWGKRLVLKTKTPVSDILTNIEGRKYIDEQGFYYQVLDFNNGVKGFVNPMKEEIIYYKEFTAQKVISVAESIIAGIPALPKEKQGDIIDLLISLLKKVVNFLTK